MKLLSAQLPLIVCIALFVNTVRIRVKLVIAKGHGVTGPSDSSVWMDLTTGGACRQDGVPWPSPGHPALL